MMFDACVQLYFQLEEGQDLVQASRHQDLVCADRLKDMFYEARTQALISYYANFKSMKVDKEQVREMMSHEETDLTEEQYMLVISKT
jgi:hypothetical protein